MVKKEKGAVQRGDCSPWVSHHTCRQRPLGTSDSSHYPPPHIIAPTLSHTCITVCSGLWGTGSSSLCPPPLFTPHLLTPVGSCLNGRAVPAVAVALDRRLEEGLAPGGK